MLKNKIVRVSAGNHKKQIKTCLLLGGKKVIGALQLVSSGSWRRNETAGTHTASASAGTPLGDGHRRHFPLLVTETFWYLHNHLHNVPWPLLPLRLSSRCGLWLQLPRANPQAPRDRGTQGHASWPGIGKLRIDSFYSFNSREIFKVCLFAYLTLLCPPPG